MFVGRYGAPNYTTSPLFNLAKGMIYEMGIAFYPVEWGT